MIAKRIRHVLVTDDARLIGVVSERDLFSLQRLGLGELTTEIRLAGEVATLENIAAEIRKLTRLLVEQGVAAEQLTLYVSVLNDRLCQRVIEVVRKRHQWEQISWCWLGFGSEGRLEQTFSTDQDNGIIFVGARRRGSCRSRARGCCRLRGRERGAGRLRISLVQGQRDGVQSGAVPVGRGVARRRWAAGWRNWEPKALLDAIHLFRFPPAVR